MNPFAELGMILGIVGPLLAVIYYALVVRVQKLEDARSEQHEKYVTRDFFNMKMESQDESLKRIEVAQQDTAKKIDQITRGLMRFSPPPQKY